MAGVRWTDKASRDLAWIDAWRMVELDPPPISEVIREL